MIAYGKWCRQGVETLLDDSDTILCCPLSCFVFLSFGLSCHVFSIIKLCGQHQISVVLQREQVNSNTEYRTAIRAQTCKTLL